MKSVTAATALIVITGILLNKMTNCNCKEPCEDCKEEKADLDGISSLLFDEVNNENIQEEEQKPDIGSDKPKTKSAKKESLRNIECETIDYKDPVSEEYKIRWNNKMGCTVWNTETRNFNF